MGGIPYINTRIGEHDYGSNSGCCGHASCKYFKEFCPLLNVQKIGEAKAVTWQSVMKARLEGGSSSEESFSRGDAASKSIYDYGDFSGISGEEKGQLSKEVDVGRYTCWGDGSGFEYDLMSRNVVGPGGVLERVYDIFSYGIDHKALTYSEWNAWVDKFQYDYRYGRVSDTNAECVLFPNVDNPWMMTEYVYQGVGGDNASGKNALSMPSEYVVEPPVYDAGTLKIVNGDVTVNLTNDTSWSSIWKEKYEAVYSSEVETVEKEGEGGEKRTEKTVSIRKFRVVEPWGRVLKFSREEINSINGKRKTNKASDLDESGFDDADSTGLPSADVGIVLYRARIPVQSVKWGEHGNIPPHTLDMMAPADWMDPTASVSKIRARYVAHVGTPFYANRDGVITWKGSQAYIENFSQTAMKTDGAGRRIYTYSVTGEGFLTAMPYKWDHAKERILTPFEKVMGVAGTDNVCHGGCALCSGSGNPNGVLKCGHLSGLADSDSDGIADGNSYFVREKCMDAGDDGHGCPYFVKSRRHPLIATYQVNVVQRNQITNNMANIAKVGMMMGVLGGPVGGLIGAGITANAIASEIDMMYQQYKNLSNYREANITYELKYETVHAPLSPARLNKKKYNEFGKGVQIVPGTGKYAFDSEKDANPFSGGDTNVYGDISTLSFGRFFRSVMPCAKQAHCHAFAGIDQADGWQAGVKAGGDGKCRYYCDRNGMGCPYNGPSKRAVEFANTASSILEIASGIRSSYETLTYFGCWDLTAGYVFNETAKRYRKYNADSEDPDSPTWLIVDEAWSIKQDSDGVATVAVKISDRKVESNVDCSERMAGAALLASDDAPYGHAVAFKFRTSKSTRKVMNRPWYKPDDGSYGMVDVSVYEVLDVFYWYQPLYNDGGTVSKNNGSTDNPRMRQHVDSNGYWFCKAGTGTGVPESNCIIVDNEERFIGGWHPEYKDYSKIGSEFMQDIVSDASREGQAMGDYVQNGDYTPIPQAVNKKGYWIDQSGEYIVDERDIGWDVAIAGQSDRDGNGGSAPCISFHKTNSTMDMETGKRKQPKVDHAAVFANDPRHLVVDEYKAGKKPEFEDPETGNKYTASCWVKEDGMLLPTMRHALHCTKCDYYIHIRYLTSEGRTCPWCGSSMTVIHGSTGSGFGSGGEGGSSSGEAAEYAAEGKTWKDDLPSASVIKKFFKLYSMGTADVWAPPGTSIPTDAYFWRHQSTITNATKRQIYHRLGTKGQSNLGKKNAEVEGNPKVGYMFDTMTRIGELTMGYPEGLGAFMPVPKGRNKKADDSGEEGDGDDMTWVETSADTDTDERYGKSYIKWNDGDSADVVGMYNPVMPRHMIPALYSGYDSGLEDEGVIAPYTTSSTDALKILSLDQIRALRNAIEPMYAYVSEEIRYGEYPTLRASYDQRETQDQPIIFQGRRAMIRPVVLAWTDDDRDSFQSYYSGDLVYGNVREYFPSGYTWWYMQQLLGGRVTLHHGGRFHMDDTKKTNESAGHVFGGSGGEYTCGDRTIAKCAISLYGMLPLDKEIVKAYVIVEPSGVDPSKNPVGRSWTGGPAMYYHYHAKVVDHFNDGQEQHLHGTAGYPNEEYFDENGKHVSPHGPNWFAPLYQDESAYRLWGAQSHSVDDDRFIYYEETFSRTMADLPGLFDTSFYKNMGTPKGTVMDEAGENELGSGYSGSSFPENDGFTRYNFRTDRKRGRRYQYLVVDADGNLVLKYPEAEVWKTKTAEEIQEVIDRNTCEVEFKASDGTEEGTVSYVFTETDAEVYQDEVPDQSQAISGYFDMGWTNSRGYVTGKYRIDAGNGVSMWNAPVIFQDMMVVTDGAGGYAGGGDNGDNEGKTARVLDVTEPITKMYNNRIKRSFGVDAGKSIETLSSWTFYSPAKEDIDSIDGDIANQNKYVQRDVISWRFNSSIVLTEVNAYPKVDDNGDIPEISEEGDKYELADEAASFVASFNLPMTISGDNGRYGTSEDQKLSDGTYSTRDAVLGLLKTVFSGSTFEKIGTRKIRVKSGSDIRIPDIGGQSFYSLIGVPTGSSYVAMRDRTVQCSSSLPGYEPARLLITDSRAVDASEDDASKTWRYNVETDAAQSFTFDLARAPLLMKERGWRYTAGDKDNPSDGIKTYFYDKPFSENCLISSIYFKPAASSEYQCESYRVMLKRSGSDAWYKSFGCHRVSGGYVLDGAAPDTAANTSFLINMNEIADYRYVKVECESNPKYVSKEYLIAYYEGVDSDGNAITSKGYQAILSGSAGEFDDFVDISLAGLKAYVGSSEDPEDPDPDGDEDVEIRIVAAQVLGEKHDRMRVFMDREIGEDEEYEEGGVKYMKFQIRRYCGGVDELVVYGIPYKTEKGDDSPNKAGSGSMYLTMTEGYDTYEMSLAGFNSSIVLPFTPCEIAKVTLNGGVGISLTSTDTESSVKWTTEDMDVSVLENGEYVNKTIKVIKSGTYHYDPVRRVIKIPSSNQNGVSWTKFEEAVANCPTFRTYLPSSAVVWYSDGNGKSITLPAIANGVGPSFMVEKGAINTIVSSECSLLDTGRRSCRILNPNATGETDVSDYVSSIPFVCSNGIPATLSIDDASRSNSKQGTVKFNAGEFRIPAFTGKELIFHEDSDQVFIDLFGDCACNCWGKCSTEVTFTGPANYVISGHITVEAPEKTTRTVKFGDNTVEYEELTGGIKQGFLIVQCCPLYIGHGRMTKCYSLPKLLVYAKERDPYTEKSSGS